MRLSEAERARRRQVKADKRRREELPLFATATGVLEQVAPLRSVAEYEHDSRRMEQEAKAQHLERLRFGLERWLHYRAIAERYFTLAAIGQVERYCHRTFPSCEREPVYRADHWRTLLRSTGLEV